ncbi:hypothetical protein Dimus_003719, partial [Dionaea muscipula]
MVSHCVSPAKVAARPSIVVEGAGQHGVADCVGRECLRVAPSLSLLCTSSSVGVGIDPRRIGVLGWALTGTYCLT